MGKRLAGLGAVVAAATWYFVASYLGEFFRKFFIYEPAGKLLHAPIDRINSEWLIRIGPSLLLVSFGLYLFYRTKIPPALNKVDEPASKSDTRHWVSGYDIWSLADPEVLQIADNLEAEVRRTQQEIAKRRELMKSPVASLLGVKAPTQQIQALETAASELATRYAATDRKLITANRKIVENLYEKLACGKLIAKGFRHPTGSNCTFGEISAEEWRILRFNFGNKQAEGHGIKYVRVAVAKRE